MLDAAAAELVERGYGQFTVGAVAERAHTSKSTVYSWFGNREGLLRAMIEHYYDSAATTLNQGETDAHSPVDVLTNLGSELIQILQGEVALALHRAASTAPELRPNVLAASGARIMPQYAKYLRQLSEAGVITVDDSVVAAKLFFGMCLQDDHARALLGEPAMTQAQAIERARYAANAFLKHYAPQP